MNQHNGDVFQYEDQCSDTDCPWHSPTIPSVEEELRKLVYMRPASVLDARDLWNEAQQLLKSRDQAMFTALTEALEGKKIQYADIHNAALTDAQEIIRTIFNKEV